MNTNEENQKTKHKKRNPKKVQILPLNENKKQLQQKKNQVPAKPEEIFQLQLKAKGFIGVQRPVIIDELNVNSEAIKYRHFGNLRKTLTDVNNSNETIDEDGRPQKRIKKCIIRCTHGFRTLAFQPDVGDDKAMNVINNVINFLFFLDILLNFRTTYFHQRTGEEETNPKKIFQNYLFSFRFVLDVLASVPLDTFASAAGANTKGLEIFGILKLIRILKLGKIIATMRVRDNVKMSFQFAQLFLFLILYLHICTCI